MTDSEYIKTRKATADALINWAKTGIRQFAMREAVNDYLEVSGATAPPSVAKRPSSHTENSSQPTGD